MIKAKELLKEGFSFHIGSKESSFWFEAWTNDEPLCNKVTYVNIQDINLRLMRFIGTIAGGLMSLQLLSQTKPNNKFVLSSLF